MKIGRVGLVVLSVFLLSGCATWSASNVEMKTSTVATQNTKVTKVKKRLAKDIVVTETDITDRAYRVLADIETTVNKTTIFHPDPTRAAVREQLRKEAAAIGADAVILVRFGTIGIGLLSWGSLEGKGRAIVFTK